ncbi:MAG: PIN domain-containing protein [Nanoarchaeota archaeon]
MVVFLDTYAMIELSKGNENYKEFIGVASMTTRFNLVELYFYFLKNSNENIADEIYSKFKSYEIPVTDKIIKEAMKFKINHIKRRFSFADCIGYISSLNENAKFLTGDSQFKDMPNVVYVR